MTDSKFTVDDFSLGQDVAIHPAHDLYMRGIRHAKVVKVGRKYIHVAPYQMGGDIESPTRPYRVLPDHLLP